jgi:hypothetical protein
MRHRAEEFNKILTSEVPSRSGGSDELRCTVDGISWTDLDSDEQRTIAMLAEGVSTALCDPVALMTLRRIGLVTGSQLTPAAEQMLSAAVLRAFAA